MANDPEMTLIYPPFPRLAWEEPFWVAKVTLPSWRGFQPRYGPDGTPRRLKKAAEPARLSVSLPEELTDEDVRAVPSPDQAAAYRHLLDNEQAVQASVLRALFEAYPRMRESYEFWGEDEAEEEAIRARLMPEVERPEGLRTLVALREVHVLPVSKDGAAYVGFELDCTWDGEHGLGVMTHAGRVVTVGGADTSFDSEVAQQDARPRKRRGK